MSDKPVFEVAVVGLDAPHLRLIEIVFRHIHHNRYAFRLAPPSDPSGAHVLIACVADPAGRAALCDARAAAPRRSAIAVVGPDDPADAGPAIPIGQLVRQLLPILNRVVELDGHAGGPRRRTAPPEVAPSHEPLHAGATAAVAMPFELPPRRRVLIVDTGGAALAGALQRMGFASEIAGGCADARVRLRRTRFDLVLAELALPDGDGLELARALRREEAGAAPPVVVVSRRRSVLDVIRAAAAGCAGFLAKPVREADLRLAVARALYGREAPDTVPLPDGERAGRPTGVALR